MQAAPLVIDNATLLGYVQSIEYFGGDIGFKKTVEVSVECASSDISDTWGVSSGSKDIWSLLDFKKDYGELTINGKPFGAAKITSYSVPQDDMINSTKCTISFIIHQPYDDITSLSGYYADYADASLKGEILNSFSDTLSLDRGENSTSFSRSIDIELNKSLNIENSSNLVRNYVREILGFSTFSWPDLSAFEGEINDLNSLTFKKFTTESIDEIGLKFSFEESLSTGNVQGDYSLVCSQSSSTNQSGITTVSESGSIEGLTSPKIDAAYAGYDLELVNARLRIQGLFDYYNEGCSPLVLGDTGDILFFAKGRTINEYEGVIEYNFSATNDPKYKNGDGEAWEYTISVSDDGTFQSSTEEGTVTGRGRVYDREAGTNLDVYVKYTNAKDFFVSTVLPDMDSRISAQISDPSPKNISRKETHAPRSGTISYSRSFSNHPRFARNGTGAGNLVKTVDWDVSVGHGIPIKSRFISLNPSNAKEIIQERGTKSLTSVGNSIRILGYRIPWADEYTEYQRLGDIAKDHLNLVNMETEIDILQSCSFQYKGANDHIFTLSTSHAGGEAACP
tara:strand:+ start:48270 stop:49964 length:1695 start_codon:yes stop_codon:yes gene_type:complete